MAGQERKTVGEQIAARLERRVRRRARVGLAETLLARFGLPEGDLSFGGEGQVDGDMVFLSIQPFLARMRRLAWSRRRRELRLARLAERYGARMERPIWRRWPGVSTGLSAAAPWATHGLDVLSTGDMHLPPAAPRAPAPAAEEEQAVPTRRRSGWTGARVSDSPWLITPFIPARVIRGQPRQPQPATPVVVVRSAGAPVAAPPSAPHPQRALDRAGARVASSSSASSSLLRAVQDSAPSLSRTARGRRLARQLVEIAALPAEEQVVQVRRVLRQAGAARRVVTEQVEQALPTLVERPTSRAVDRAAAASGQRASRGLRPVTASSPSMQAVRAAVEPVALAQPQEPSRGPRPSRRAAARAVSTDLASQLSSAPVARSVARGVRALSASPMSQGRSRAPAPARRAASTSAKIRQAQAASPASTSGAAATPAPAAASSPARPGRSAARRAARAADDGPGPGPEGPLAGDPEREPLVAPSRKARATARAAQRLELGDEQPWQAPVPGPSLAASDARPARFAVTRSPRGAFVPAVTLARAERPEAPPAPDAPSAAGSRARPATAPAAPSARPAPRLTVRSVPSTARVAQRRALASTHAADRALTPLARPGSLRASPVTPQQPPAASAVPTPAATRRLAAVRDAGGTFVQQSRRVESAADPVAPAPSGRAARRAPGAPAPMVAQPSFDAAAGPLDSSPAQWAARRLDLGQEAPPAGRRPSLLPPVVTSLAAPLRSAAPPEATTPATPATPGRRAAAPTQVAAARAERSPVVAQAVRRTVDGAPSRAASAPAGAPPDAPTRTITTRARPNPAAYAARYGLAAPSQVWIEVQDLPAPATGEPVHHAPRRAGPRTSPLDRLDLRALALGELAAPASAPIGASTARAAQQRAIRTGGGGRDLPAAALGAVVRPGRTATTPAASSEAPSAAAPRPPRAVPPAAWARSRADGPSVGPTLRSPAPRERGGFDLLGTYRAPLAAGRRGGAPATSTGAGGVIASSAPERALLRPDRAPSAAASASPFAMPGAAAPPRDRRVRPDLGVTLGAVDQGVADRALPTWAFRATGEPMIRAEGQFIDALARASEPEEILRVIYQRAARGNLTAASTGLPAPVIQVIEQIRAVAGQVDLAATAAASSAGVRGGPSSDAEVLRRSGVRREPPRSTARVASGMTSLRGRGSASRRDGVGADGISKLSKKLQELILLAERQRQAARQQVRMAEDSAAARAEGHASPGSGEGGIDKKIDIEALGREVLEVVSQELEMRKARSQEGSDEYGWW